MRRFEVRRLGSGDNAAAAETFSMLAGVFDESAQALSEDYLEDLLGRPGFWVLAAFLGQDVVGGLTAHTLPMTTLPAAELFIYDLAVRKDHQRAGVGGLLVERLREIAAPAGIREIFVAADNEDLAALDFYRAKGANGSPVTVFTFAPR